MIFVNVAGKVLGRNNISVLKLHDLCQCRCGHHSNSNLQHIKPGQSNSKLQVAWGALQHRQHPFVEGIGMLRECVEHMLQFVD